MKTHPAMKWLVKFWEIPMRTRIGMIAFVLLAIAAVTFGMSCFGNTRPSGATAACLRTGAPMFFLWLAWPDIAAFPRWILRASVPTVLLVAIFPKLLFLVVPLVLLLLFLQPKQNPSRKKKANPGAGAREK